MRKVHALRPGYERTLRWSSAGFFCSWLLVLCASCSTRSTPQAGGETHWLAICTDDHSCGGNGLVCACGTCTRACSGDAACGGSSTAACFDVSSPLLLQRCEARSLGASHGICLSRCTSDKECSGGRTCSAGACLPAPVASARAPDAGAASALAGLHVSDFNNVDAAISWTTPVTVPIAKVVIAGADQRLLGTWREVDCDPSTTGNWGGCRRLVIEQAASGDVTGHVNYDRTHDVLGPFAPPQNPDVGYPTGVDPTQYGTLMVNPQAGVDYRMLDGRLEGNKLTFTWSTIDLWHAWCQLQTPYLWQIDNHGFHFCVPQSYEAQKTIDPGKVVLCTSADFRPLCSDGNGGLWPCVCMDPPDGGGRDPRCGGSMCDCDGQTCDIGAGGTQVELTVDGDRMTGVWGAGTLDSETLTFDRVSP